MKEGTIKHGYYWAQLDDTNPEIIYVSDNIGMLSPIPVKCACVYRIGTSLGERINDWEILEYIPHFGEDLE